ncbi:MAG: hypothetical protein KMY54_03465, partial [Erysipelothrix sp.]|nr:hypothetical protein [Erysipelothrix sp.]
RVDLHKNAYGMEEILKEIGAADGLVNDPCLPALERISSVLTELNISIKRMDLLTTLVPL